MHKILIIDDTPDVLENLAEFLALEGYQVLGATNGEAALQKLEFFPADLIITDLRMPGIDGFELIQILKHQSQFKNIPIVVFSANVTPENSERCLKLGARKFITKPCSTDHLAAEIALILPADQ